MSRISEKQLIFEVRNKLNGRSLRNVQNDYPGVSIGTLSRIASKGECPKGNWLRDLLNLPHIEKVEACEYCGKVHVRKCKGSFEYRLAVAEISIEDKLYIKQYQREIKRLINEHSVL